MQNAPARQPRVSTATPRKGRAWVTPACLVGAALLAGVVMLPPFAAGTLFPNRSIASASVVSRAIETVAAQTGTPNATIAQSGDKPDGDIEAKYSDLPPAAEPANDPPRSAASEAMPASAPAGGTLATGVFASRPAPEPGAAAEPTTELALQPIPPIGAAAATPAEARPAISSPPSRREGLPLQTDLLPTEMPGPPSLTQPGPDRRG